MTTSLLLDLGLIVLFAAICANIVRLFRQPLILGYVLSGILLGPLALKLVTKPDFISNLAELGIAFLLFIVGMELDLKKIKEVGSTVIIVSILQVILTTFVGALVAYKFVGLVEAIYLGLVVAFSSTIIVVKLLYDKHHLETIHGRIVLGILLAQDIIAMILMPFLINIQVATISLAGILFLKAIGLLVLGLILGKLIQPIIKSAANHPELLFITALANCFIFIGLAYFAGFSIAIGAFIGGIALASSSYTVEIVGRISSLRDFFVVIFFAVLGLQLTSFNMGNLMYLLLALVIVVILLKPLILFFLLKLLKHSNRVSFISSLSLSQISEFSLIIAAQGLVLNHIQQSTYNLIILIAIITITLTSYIIKFDRNLFSTFGFVFKNLEKNGHKDLEYTPKKLQDHIILVGGHRMGGNIIQTLLEKRKNFVVVDYNPDVIRKLIRQNIPCIYGDYSNMHLLEHLNLDKAKVVISTVPDLTDNKLLIKKVREVNKKAIIFISSHSVNDALILYKEGADFVIQPEVLAGQKLASYLNHLSEKGIRKWGKFYYDSMLDNVRKGGLIW